MGVHPHLVIVGTMAHDGTVEIQARDGCVTCDCRTPTVKRPRESPHRRSGLLHVRPREVPASSESDLLRRT